MYHEFASLAIFPHQDYRQTYNSKMKCDQLQCLCNTDPGCHRQIAYILSTNYTTISLAKGMD